MNRLLFTAGFFCRSERYSGCIEDVLKKVWLPKKTKIESVTKEFRRLQKCVYLYGQLEPNIGWQAMRGRFASLQMSAIKHNLCNKSESSCAFQRSCVDYGSKPERYVLVKPTLLQDKSCVWK